MPYDNIISRTDAQALIPEEVSRDMLARATTQSAVLSMFRRIPVSRNQVRFPILSALPTAYWVTGNTGAKQVSEVNWNNKFLNIEEIAAIMPVPDTVLADVEVNLWDEIMPYMVEAFGRVLDATVFFGTNAPSSFPAPILDAAASAGNQVTEGAPAAQGGFFGDIDALHEKVEADGFDVNGWVAAVSTKSRLRKARDTRGRKLDEARVNGDLSTLDGWPVTYPMRGLWPSDLRLFGGDWSQFVIGVRQDIAIKVLTEAVIQDSSGQIIYNLAQQDMTAVRLTFRVGWQVSNLLTHDQPETEHRYPVAVLTH